uniref:tRNA modification GTPase n=1 Tax=Globodera rostochiensis TaxID=31243 RepID=A0A914HY40_GLORO
MLFSRRFFSTIFALSSGSPPSAIAVIRISGDRSESTLRVLTRSKRPFDDRRLFYTPIFGDDGLLLDKGMACLMKGPRTFTGEDSAELYLHGSRAVIQAVCETLAKISGLESAKAGEFTRRAFFNGKLDVAQMEALADLLGAETPAQLRLCHAQAKVGAYLSENFTRRIDFAEDIGDEEQSLAEEFSAEIRGIGQQLRRFLRSAKRGQLIRSGLKVALVGRPNVGKSSLMNRLAERELAIVSNISGTTRDCLETRIQLNGQLVNVVDTAGIREGSEDPLEREGIRRTLQRASEADLVLLVMDSGDLFGSESDRSLVNSLLAEFAFDSASQRLIVVVNKSDLVKDRTERLHLERTLKRNERFLLAWTSCVREDEDGVGSEGCEVFLSRERHVQCLERALTHLEETEAALAEWDDPAMAALTLRLCLDAVGEIAGRVVHEQVLDSIFSQFCIGK